MSASSTDAPVGVPVYGIGFGGAFRRFWKGYVVFRGRASRSEFWWAQLGVTLVLMPVAFIAGFGGGILGALLSPTIDDPTASSRDLLTFLALVLGPALLMLLLMLPVLLPTYAITTRRVRDAGFSPWLVLLYLVPLGGYAVLVLTILPTKPDPMAAAGPWQQPVAYGQPGFDAQPVPYGQPNAYGQPIQPTPYGQPSPYGQPNPYDQPQQQP